MCLIAIAWRAHPDYPLIVAANRDEFFARPTAAAHWWPDRAILAGRDRQAGGTWLGITATGRFAAVTNFRQAPRNHAINVSGEKRSRGALVTDFLGHEEPARYAAELTRDADDYAGFNLLFGRVEGALDYFSNRGAARRDLASGVYGLSNALLDERWPKVDYVKSALSDALQKASLSPGALLDLLQEREQAADERLPDTGVGLDAERFLSSPFIVGADYGTRSSTALVIGRGGEARFLERNYDEHGRENGDHAFAWRLSTPPLAAAV